LAVREKLCHNRAMRRFRLALLALAVMLPGLAAADQTDRRLPGLFERLKGDGLSAVEARVIEAQIWQIWSENSDAEVNAMMRRGVLAMNQDEEVQALASFNAIVQRQPDFAEGWNKRATVYYLMGDFTASVADIEKTLELEPHHFGALSGLGLIYLALDRKAAALKAFEGALAIDPHLVNAKAAVESLKKQLEGDPT
jgi:tetratricopeptide (TPR) repeat protein